MKIQMRLMLVIIPVIVALFGITSLITNFFSTSALEKQVRQNMSLLSKSYSTQINATLRQYTGISEDLASATVTAINVETTLQVVRKRYPQFTSIFYTPPSGRVLDMAPYDKGFVDHDFSGTPAWKKAFETQRPALSAPGEYFGYRAIIFFAPALISYVANQGPTVVGMVALVLPLNELFTDIENVVIGSSGSIFIADRSGVFLHHETGSRILSGTVESLSRGQSLSSVQDAMIHQKTGFATFNDGSSRKFIAFSPIPSAEWSLGVYGSYEEFTSDIFKMVLINLIIIILGVLSAGVVLYFVVHGVVSPIERLTEMAQKVEKGDRTITSDISDNSETGMLSRSINAMVMELRDNQKRLEATVEERTLELKRTNEELEETNEELNASNNALKEARDALWTEMELAHKLQTVLIPEKPVIEGYDICAFVETTKTVGGDFFDVIHVGDRDWFLIGDVSGHGVNSGLIMMMVQTSIHVALSQNPLMDPSKLLSIINTTIHNNIHKLGERRYITLTVFACHQDGRFIFSGAHLPLVRYRKATGHIEITQTEGTWIGLVDNIAGMNSDSTYLLEEGDALLLFTDGITESNRRDGSPFTQDDLSALFLELAHLPARDIVAGIRGQMNELVCDDDVTIFIMKRTEKHA